MCLQLSISVIVVACPRAPRPRPQNTHSHHGRHRRWCEKWYPYRGQTCARGHSGTQGITADVDRAALTNTMVADGVTTRAAMISVVVATETRSEHSLPGQSRRSLGQRFTGGCYHPKQPSKRSKASHGRGVRATVSLSSGQKYTVWIGSAHFITQSDVSNWPSGLSTFQSSESRRGLRCHRIIGITTAARTWAST